MADPKKILVLESEKLMSAGILSLLASWSEFDVAQTTAVSLGSREQSDFVQPDVVILDEELLAANLLALVQLTESHPKLRLIVLSLNGSNVNIFDKQTIQISSVSDFVELLGSLSENDLSC